ncbi:uncharacterized protein LOC119549730 [Drosophila subpulchrella]|uniref:uncharacterized protein LOC119549730 n=1 Tax=Drosophila subpulchrella TaxID=1486046 RepID=UPI0018A137D7|nr:uncharacterized protein LOC119549730 [Drosophila subpulchrella]
MNNSHKWTRRLLIGLIVLSNYSYSGSPLARHLRLRPLRPAEIRELESSLLKGRSVSSGFAALTGFALGLGKALTGVFIYDVITANITESEETNVSANCNSVREICFDNGNSNSDVTCLVYYTNN